jgi:nitric oxide reductase NorD protein
MGNGALARLRAAIGRRWRGADDGPATEDAPAPVALEDVRRRLELLLAGVYGHPITVAAAEPPREPRVRRILNRVPPHLRNQAPLAASDGTRVLLPERLETKNEDALARYRIMAVQQAERLVRGTAQALPADAPPLVRDLYLLAEGAAVEEAITRGLPGLAGAQAAERAAALNRRPPADSLTPAERQVETLVRGVLAGQPGAALPELTADSTPEQSLAWARATAARLALSGARYRGVPPVDAWGTVLPPADAAAAPRRSLVQRFQPLMKHVGKNTRFGPAARSDDAADAGKPLAPTNDPLEAGSQKLADPRGDTHMDGGADPGEPGGDPPPAGGSAPGGSRREAADETGAEAGPAPAGIEYPEWDHETGRYRRHGAWVRIAATAPGDGEWARKVLRAHAAAVRRLREQFERLRARRLRLTQQREGEELDLEACVRALVDQRTGHTVSDRLYAAVRPARRELSILLLVDISGSTTEHVNRVRIIDVEMETLILASEAFDALGDPYAILTFSGKGAGHVRVRMVKDFAERNGDGVRGRVAALRPEGYTRMGAAIRHASALLARQGARHRLLLIISDGKPNDEDHYQGRFAVEDTRQAVVEARTRGIFPFCVTVDQKGGGYLSRIFGASGHMILHHPEHLPLALVKVVRGLLRG